MVAILGGLRMPMRPPRTNTKATATGAVRTGVWQLPIFKAPTPYPADPDLTGVSHSPPPQIRRPRSVRGRGPGGSVS